MAGYSRPTSREEFDIAIICASPLEFDAVSLAFDEFWDEDGDTYGRARGDQNAYTTGRIGKYNVVLALLPNMGKASTAGTAASLRSSYTRLRLAILAGICSGVPYPANDSEILLGDVVISKHIVQYDYGSQYPDKFVMKDTIYDTPGRPNKDIRSLLAIFETEHGLENLQSRTIDFLVQIQQIAKAKGRKFRYEYPGANEDKLFEPAYVHRHQKQLNCDYCESYHVCRLAITASCEELQCDTKNLVSRQRLRKQQQQHHEQENKVMAAHQPQIFLGSVGTGDIVLKSGQDRDRIANTHNLIAFEMEGAGLWDEVPCIIVKGVSDYADSHKNKGWQPFAAAMAASATKAVISRYIQTDRPADSHGSSCMYSVELCHLILTTLVAVPFHPKLDQSKPPPNVSFMIPFEQDSDFVERKHILDQVHQKCAKPCSRAALVGLGGVGQV